MSKHIVESIICMKVTVSLCSNILFRPTLFRLLIYYLRPHYIDFAKMKMTDIVALLSANQSKIKFLSLYYECVLTLIKIITFI